MNFIKKNWLSLLLVIFVGAVILIPKFGDFIRSQVLMSPTISKIKSEVTVLPEEYYIDLKGVNAPDTNLKNFQGKPVFVNFWGTWCPPCRAEWPSIQKLYDAKKGKIDFVLIAMQDQEPAIRKFLEENKYTVPVYIAQSPLPEKLLPNVFPTTFLIAKDGQILMKEEASKDWFSADTQKFIDGVTK